MPIAQARQARASSYLPATHCTQEPELASPVASAYVPFGQALQSPGPPLKNSSRYVCSGHSRQRLAPIPAYLPSPHPEHASAPPVETVPIPHSPHAVTPAPEKLPAAQAVHTRLASYLPASHAVQAYLDWAPVYGETVPAPQATQSSTEPLKPVSRYVWNGQGVQELLPAGAYVPTEQGKQASAPS